MIKHTWRAACADRHRHDLEIQLVRAEGWCGLHQGETQACTPGSRRATAQLQRTLWAISLPALPTGRQTAAVRHPKQGNTTVEEQPRLRFTEDEVSKRMTGQQWGPRDYQAPLQKQHSVASQKESVCCSQCLMIGIHCPPCHGQHYLWKCKFLMCAGTGMQTGTVNALRLLQ